MRIAWIGPLGDGGGVPSMGALLMESVLRQPGVSVEYFGSVRKEQLPGSLPQCENLTVTTDQSGWQWGKWYSRTPMLSFLSGSVARARAYNRLATRLIERHRAEPFDCVFQFSWAELFKLGRHLDELPPLVVYPCVHTAGELRWHRRESRYARQSEKFLMHYAVRLFLTYRAWRQRGEYRKPAMVLGMSRRFNEIAAEDYGLDPAAMGVLYHPIALPQESQEPQERAAKSVARQSRPIKLLYVSRISVRKGLEQIVELSRRLDDLHGQVQLDVIGSRTQWSDYTGHLKELNPRIARHVGWVDHIDMAAIYASADALVLPSMYEPGGLVVGEALARGACVVASDEVGSAEPVAADVCRKFPAGDVDAFEKSVRDLIDDIRTRGPELREHAADEARRHFAPEKIALELIEHLRCAAVARAPGQALETARAAELDLVVVR